MMDDGGQQSDVRGQRSDGGSQKADLPSPRLRRGRKHKTTPYDVRLRVGWIGGGCIGTGGSDFHGFDFVQVTDKAVLGIGAHQAVLAHDEADDIAAGQPGPTNDALFVRVAGCFIGENSPGPIGGDNGFHPGLVGLVTHIYLFLFLRRLIDFGGQMIR